jgi:hypothetical protein
VAPMGSGAIPIRDKPAQVEVVAADASPGAEGIRTNEAEPWLEDVIDGDASALEPLGGRAYWVLVESGPCSSPPGNATSGDVILALGSSKNCGNNKVLRRLQLHFSFFSTVLIMTSLGIKN